MNMKTAIIIGVIILMIPLIIAPFFMSKNTDNDSTPNIIGELSGDNAEISGDVSVKEEIKKDEETIINPNDSGDISSNTNIEENVESVTNESNLSNGNIEVNSSILNESVENDVSTNIKPTEIKQEQKVEVKVEQKVEVQAPIQEQIETIINDVVIPTEAVGVLKIDKIGLYQPVMEGHSLEVLKTHLGHVDGSAYWRGNIGILGHNNGNAGFFKRLTELKIDDVIEYITEDGTRTYKVSEVTEIEDTDWSKFARTEDNRITLVTCVRNVPTKRYCVQAIEI